LRIIIIIIIIIFINCNWVDTRWQNRVLRRIFGPKRDEGTGEWRKLHTEELKALYSSPNIILVIKSRRMRWARHVACMGERGGEYRGLVGRPERQGPLGRPRRRWEVILRWILGKCDLGARTRLIWLRIETGGGHL
jgi:hypothetical protein